MMSPKNFYDMSKVFLKLLPVVQSVDFLNSELFFHPLGVQKYYSKSRSLEVFGTNQLPVQAPQGCYTEFSD